MQKKSTYSHLSLISDWSAEMFILHFTKKMFTLWNYICNRKNSKIIVLIQIKLQTFIQRIQTIFFINWVAITQMVLRSLIGLLVIACGASKNGAFPRSFAEVFFGIMWHVLTLKCPTLSFPCVSYLICAVCHVYYLPIKLTCFDFYILR